MGSLQRASADHRGRRAKVDNRRTRYLTAKEAQVLLAALKERSIFFVWRMATMSLYTGLRAREILKCGGAYRPSRGQGHGDRYENRPKPHRLAEHPELMTSAWNLYGLIMSDHHGRGMPGESAVYGQTTLLFG